MLSCAIIPTIKDKQGNIVDSKFFKDLLSYTPSRNVAVEIYEKTITEKFKNEWVPSLNIELNEYGEPLFTSLLEKTNLLKAYNLEKSIINRLSKTLGIVKEGTTRYKLYPIGQYTTLLKRAQEFNTTSPFRKVFTMEPIKVNDNESHRVFWTLQISKRKEDKSTYALDVSNLEYNKVLNEKLRDILLRHGIKVGALEKFEEDKGISGVTEFHKMKDVAEGLIELIRIAQNERGEKALPEEFAHFVIEAMGEHPMIIRLLDFIKQNNLAKEIIGNEYDTYSKLYNNNEEQLVKESAGKLLAKHLLKAEEIPNAPYRNILQRALQAIKNFFKKIKISEVKKALAEADKSFGDLAKQILNGSLDDKINIKNITESRTYFNLNERLERDTKLLQNIINNELKRLKIYEQSNPNSQFNIEQKIFIDDLEEQLALNNSIEGVYMFLQHALKQLKLVVDKLDSLSNSGKTVKEKAKILRNARNYIYSYSRMIDNIQDVVTKERKYADNRYAVKIVPLLNETLPLISQLRSTYTDIATPLFVDFIRPFTGNTITVPFGDRKGEVLNAEDLVKKANRDITLMDTWLDSMADSSDHMLRSIDQVVKTSKDRARLNTIEISKKLQAAAIKLEQAGVKSTDWMFEKDEQGNYTGNYIQEIDYVKFKKAQKEMFNHLKEKYGEHPKGDELKAYNIEKFKWYKENKEYITIDGMTLSIPRKRTPDGKPLYENTVFTNLNSAQKEYYNTIIDIKSSLDALLPENATSLYNTVKIRKDLLERVKSSAGVKDATTQIMESLKDLVIRRTDDVDFGSKYTLIDFENRQVQTLPIYYTHLRPGENNNDVSTDITSTLTAYAAMANNYHEIGEVIDALEVGRTLLRRRDIIQQSGGKNLIEHIDILGKKVENTLTKKGEQSYFGKRLDIFFDMQVYNRYMKDEGTFGKTNIDKAKTANLVNKLSSLTQQALNTLSATANVSVGALMMNIEAHAQQFFSKSNLFKGDQNYIKALPEYLSQIGSRIKTSKLYLWEELFDISQEYDTNIQDIQFDKKRLGKLFSTNSLYFMSKAGEHWMQTRTSLALAEKYIMVSPEGKKVSLWDAMEIVPIDKNNKSLGATLQVKEGYTKENGTEFTKEDIRLFSRKSAAINQKLHGIYNKADMNAMQHVALGRMAMLYRKWIRPSLNKRFKLAQYNLDLQEWEEGYWVTSYRFFKQLATDLKNGQLSIAMEYNNLHDTEKANLRRMLMDVIQFSTLLILCNLFDADDDGEDLIERSWFTNMLEYLIRRTYTEIGALMPGVSMLKEGLKIIKSPVAGITVMERTLDLLELTNPFNYESIVGEDALIEAGIYRGKSKATKILYNSPLMPFYRTIRKGLHPEEAIPFYRMP